MTHGNNANNDAGDEICVLRVRDLHNYVASNCRGQVSTQLQSEINYSPLLKGEL